MWLKAQNEMAGLWLHAAMGPVERMVRPQFTRQEIWICNSAAHVMLGDLKCRIDLRSILLGSAQETHGFR